MQLVWFRKSTPEMREAGGWEEGEFYPSDRSESPCVYRVSKAFSVIDGKRMPAWLEIEGAVNDENIDQPLWGARIELRDGVPKIANIGFASLDHGREVKPSDFQKLRAVVYVFYSAFCGEIGPDGEPIYRTTQAEEGRIAEFLEGRRTGRQRLKTDDYKRAAQVYRDNFEDTPTQAVADAFGVGIRQAGNIVAECRRRGFLPATKQGRKKA